jgi:hypothetical protein
VSLAIFAFGIFVFLITVYGAVVSGGLMLTDRQLEVQPDLVPDYPEPDGHDERRVRRLVETSY